MLEGVYVVRKIKWETFEGRQQPYRSSREPRVTLGPKGTFYLNGVAFEVLGSPAAVEMQHDDSGRIVGLIPTDPRKTKAFKIVPHGKNGTYRRICASSFCRHLRIKPRETVVFNNPDLDDKGRLVLDLDSTTVIGRGSR